MEYCWLTYQVERDRHSHRHEGGAARSVARRHSV